MTNISFSETTDQIRARTKIVTRRFSTRPRSIWNMLKPGKHLIAIEKGQGLKKGEHITKLDEIITLKVDREPLLDIVRRPTRRPENNFEWVAMLRMCPYQEVDREKRRNNMLLVGKCKNPCNWSNDCDPVSCPGVPETVLEGFPNLTPPEFAKLFMNINKRCQLESTVTRIMFDYVVKP